MNPYEILGLPKDADPSRINRAYRALCKNHHPDKGGDPAKFNELKTAYDVLIDPERRNRYDTTGRIDKSPVTPEAVAAMVTNAVRGVVNHVGPEPYNTDVKAKVISSLQSSRSQIKDMISQTHRKKMRVERLLRNFKPKGDSDPVGDVLRQEREKLEAEMRSHEDALEMSHAVEEVFRQYDYEVGPEPEGLDNNSGPTLRRGFLLNRSSTSSHG